MALFAMMMTRLFSPIQHRKLFEGRIKSAIIITFVMALLVARVTEYILQKNEGLPFLDYTIFMFVSYLGAIIWWLTIRFVKPR